MTTKLVDDLRKIKYAAQSLIDREDFWRNAGTLPGEYDNLKDALSSPAMGEDESCAKGHTWKGMGWCPVCCADQDAHVASLEGALRDADEALLGWVGQEYLESGVAKRIVAALSSPAMGDKEGET